MKYTVSTGSGKNKKSAEIDLPDTENGLKKRFGERLIENIVVTGLRGYYQRQFSTLVNREKDPLSPEQAQEYLRDWKPEPPKTRADRLADEAANLPDHEREELIRRLKSLVDEPKAA